MLLLRLFAWIFPVGMMTLTPELVFSQSYPNKPIRMVTNEVGGGGDFVGRLIAQGISGSLGQPVIIDNRGGGVIPGEIVSKAPHDGYTLLIAGGSLWIGPLLRKTPYDAVRDFLPITIATKAPNILVVQPSLPVRSVKELISLAKAKPGALNYSTGSPGSSTHIAAELFKAMAGIDIVRIPYKGSSAGVNAVISGAVQMTFGDGASVDPQVNAGKLTALAVTSAAPSALAPGLPTVAASGLPGYESVQINALFAPARTPATIINRLNEEIVRFLQTPGANARFLNSGLEVAGGSPDELAVKMKSEIVRLGKVIKNAGINAD